MGRSQTAAASRWARVLLLLAVLAGSAALPGHAEQLKPITLRPDYRHDRWGTRPTDIVRQFEAYTTSFDSRADDGQAWGIPDFVAYEMKRLPRPLGAGPARPSPWITDAGLNRQGLAPTDDTYAHSAAFLRSHPDWYVRGHLCMKEHAWRLGANADWNTHTVLNAVPQRSSFNSGIWLALENKTAEWADKYGDVWIVTGPVIDGRRPKAYLGEPAKHEMLIAIPDALFKIVIRETRDPQRPEVLAFRFPQSHPKYRKRPGEKAYDLAYFLVTVDSIEAATGLDFLTTLPDAIEAELEARKATRLWE